VNQSMEKMFKSLCGLFAALIVFFHSPHVSAGELASELASHSEISLYQERTKLRSGVNWLAVELTPRSGWHTYWENPGDSGAAPLFFWDLPNGVTAGAPEFQAPSRIPVAHLMNYGYKDASVILLPLTVSEDLAGGKVTFDLAVEWLVCEIECVPQVVEWQFELEVAKAAPVDEATAALFAEARAKLPADSYWSGTLTLAEVSSELQLYMTGEEAAAVSDAYFFPAEDGVATYAGDQAFVLNAEGALLRIPRARGARTPQSGNGLLMVTFKDGTSQTFRLFPMLKAGEAPLQGETALPSGSAGAGSAGAGSAGSGPAVSVPIWQAAVFAFLGGLILNLMPCVFPVLSLKAFAFVSANYKTAANRRREGWAYTLGIWASFMVIVAVLQFLREGGAAIGWGFQLQEPLFIAFMAAVMVMVALSLAGMFNISFGLEGTGQGLASREGTQGAFFKGVLAALVATPCTAPLMAPAIGFALTQSLPVVVMVFSLLALGLALPFLLLSYSGKVAAMMPKPGAWMEIVKQLLAFPMLLTAVWLFYVFDLQAGPTATLMLLVAIIFLVFAVWLATRFTSSAMRIVAVVVAIATVAAFVYQSKDAAPRAAATAAEDEGAYSEARLAELRAEGKPVFVYFTAEWCITCKVNEQVALFRDDTQQAFKDKGVVTLKGDWTNRNDQIAAVLARYGRAGVPLYLYFPAGADQAIVLPEVLTVGTILDAL